MKKLLLATMLFAAIGCTKSDLPEATNADASMQKPTKKIVLRASAGAETKLGFEDNDKKGIAVTWVKNDKFSMYDDKGNYVTTFELNPESIGKQSGVFDEVEGNDLLVDGNIYTVVYPAIEAAATLDDYKTALANQNQKQTGNGTLDHMSKLCGMEMVDYTYKKASPEGISFKHTKAILTLKLGMPDYYSSTSDGHLAKISYTNNSAKTYTLVLENVDWADANGITAYIMIDPTDKPVHETYAFVTLTTDMGISYTSRDIITKSYEAGKRYTANRAGSSFNPSFTLAKAVDIPLNTIIIIILDAVNENNTEADFAVLRKNINNPDRTKASVMITMPNATVIPGAAFNKCTKLRAVDLPKVTKISNGAIIDNATIGAFNQCTLLAIVNIPLATDLGNNAFAGCATLTTINAPAVTLIGDNAFEEIGTESLITDGTISLGTAHNKDITVGTTIFNEAVPIKYDLTLGSGVSFVDVGEKTWTANGMPYIFNSISIK